MNKSRDRGASFYFYWEVKTKGRNSEIPLGCFMLLITFEMAELVSREMNQ